MDFKSKCGTKGPFWCVFADAACRALLPWVVLEVDSGHQDPLIFGIHGRNQKLQNRRDS